MGYMVTFRDGSVREFEKLKGADLRDSVFRGSSFRSRDLSGTNFWGASFDGVDFTDANLDSVDFQRASLCNVNFRNANLRCADFSSSCLQRVIFKGANLDRARFDCAAWPLWCGSLGVKNIDKRLACQLLYHALDAMTHCDDQDVIDALRQSPKMVMLSNRFHIVKCGGCDPIRVKTKKEDLEWKSK